MNSIVRGEGRKIERASLGRWGSQGGTEALGGRNEWDFAKNTFRFYIISKWKFMEFQRCWWILNFTHSAAPWLHPPPGSFIFSTRNTYFQPPSPLLHISFKYSLTLSTIHFNIASEARRQACPLRSRVNMFWKENYLDPWEGGQFMLMRNYEKFDALRDTPWGSKPISPDF